MDKFKKIFLLLCLILFATDVPASVNETLPTFHWSYSFIEELQARGFCLDLLLMNKPYTRGEIASSLLTTEIDDQNAFIQYLFKQLKSEFSNEINEINSSTEISDNIHFRTNIRTNMDRDEKHHFEYRGVYRAGIGVNIRENIFAFSGVNFDQYDYDDPAYVGAKWRGIVGYTEQAYLNLKWQRIQLKLGRDFLKWGAGESGTLILSNMTRPLDQFLAAIRFGPFKFTFFTSELDQFGSQYEYVPVRRFLAGHRLDLSLWHGRIQAAVSELILYGGPNASFNFVYLNPVIFYHGEKKNHSGDNNVLPTLDFSVYPRKNWQIYASLLIDDIQIEKTEPGDLEPNEIGWIIGTKWADPFKIGGLTVNSEYVRVANRTYKTPQYFETFVYRGKPLGHPVGNDFEHWAVGFSYWLRNGIWIKFDFSVTHKGEGSLFTPWDEPWMSHTVEQGYDEPFPTGIIEKSNEFGMTILWFSKSWLRFYGDLNYRNINNQNHVQNERSSFLEGKLRVELDWMWNRDLIDRN